MPMQMQDDCTSKSVPLGVIVQIEGKAKVLSKDSIKKHKAAKEEKLYAGDRVITYTDSKAIIKLKDGSAVILNKASELLFITPNRLRQDAGEVYYKIKKRVAAKGLKIETSFSIIGIKGTEFIVDLDDQGEIALNEGVIGIASLHAAFELHKQKMMQAYEKYKQEQMDGFEAYKAKDEEEIVSHVKAFDLEPGRMLSFSSAEHCEQACSSRVKEKMLSSDVKERFEIYKAMLSE
jgi:FecR-like protein